jgi:hypothetical protein
MIAAVAAVLLVALMGPPADAFSPGPVECTAAGQVFFVDGNVDQWFMFGRGSCISQNLEGPYIVDFTGTGTSDGGGLCTSSLVTNLSIQISGTITDAGTLVSRPLIQRWEAPLTTYPLGTPFLVMKNGSPIGLGAFFNHIFLQCQGNPAAQFTWGFLL